MDRLAAQSLPPRQLALATAGVMLAMFLSVFSQTIVATAMPRIIADLGGFDRYTWPATAYLVATAVAVPNSRASGRMALAWDIHCSVPSMPLWPEQSATCLLSARD